MSARITEAMVEAGARALDPDAFADYDRRLSYRASMDDEKERRRFADHYDERPEALRKTRLVLEAAAALSTEPGEAERWQPTHRHKKRGTTYRLDGYGELQTAAPIGDYAKVAIYRAEDGKTWVRPVSEFNDGRFEALPATPLPEDTRHGR